MIKKLVSCFSAVLLLICQFAVMSFASQPVKLTLSGGEVYAGEELTVNLFISDNSNLSGAAIKINYDKSMLEYVSGEAGGIIDSSATVSVKNIEKSSGSYVNFTYMSPSATITAEGILLSVKFKALESAVGSTDLTLTIDSPGDFVDGNLSKLSYTVENSKITVINNNASPSESNRAEDSQTDLTESAPDNQPAESTENGQTNGEDTNGAKPSDNTVKIVVIIAAGVVLIAVGATAVILEKRKKKG